MGEVNAHPTVLSGDRAGCLRVEDLNQSTEMRAE